MINATCLGTLLICKLVLLQPWDNHSLAQRVSNAPADASCWQCGAGQSSSIEAGTRLNSKDLPSC